MRISALLISFLCFSFPLAAQMPDPGASQDEEAAREKILKAADQLDLIEGNSEATKASVEQMKNDLVKLQDENAALKLEVSTLQDSFQKAEDDRAKERQVMLDEVAKLVAAKSESRPSTRKRDSGAEASLAPPADAPTAGPTNPAESAGSSDTASDATKTAAAPDAPPPKPRKGYSYTVEAGQTLTMICAAYRAEGVPVTVSQVRKANGLTEKSILQPGQKLFIPKPGA